MPLALREQHFDEKVLRRLGLECSPLDLSSWERFLAARDACEGQVNIALVGKYTSLPDAYLSVIEAWGHAGVAHGVNVEVHLIDGEALSEDNVEEVLGGMQGILVPGGFGIREFEGKICAAKYARTHKVPYLGICL